MAHGGAIDGGRRHSEKQPEKYHAASKHFAHVISKQIELTGYRRRGDAGQVPLNLGQKGLEHLDMVDQQTLRSAGSLDAWLDRHSEEERQFRLRGQEGVALEASAVVIDGESTPAETRSTLIGKPN